MARFFSLRGSACHPLALASFVADLVFGSGVDFGGDEGEEFPEVGAGPAFDGRSQSFWNHEKSFTV